MQKHLLGLLFLSLLHLQSQAQNTPLHQYAVHHNAWFMYFGDHKFSPRWGVHLEAQIRRNNGLQNPQQLLLRTGLNYHFGPQVFATVGYCYVETYPYGEFPVNAAFPENRFWEQLQIKTQLSRFEWVNRLRLEQRLSKLPVLRTDGYEPGDAVYTNRARILNRISVPFKGTTIADKSLYVTVYDEVLLGFGKNIAANALDQNRLYGALGYKIPRLGRLELGYLFQSIFKADGVKVERNHTLQVGLTSNIDFFKQQ